MLMMEGANPSENSNCGLWLGYESTLFPILEGAKSDIAGGLSCAIACLREGMRVEILEKAPEFTTVCFTLDNDSLDSPFPAS